MRMRTLAETGLLIAATVLLGVVVAGAQARTAGFPDVPPWHWAYQGVLKDTEAGVLIGYPAPPGALIENSIAQVYDGFAHAQAPEARAWVERFTFNRPSAWPGPLRRAELASFALRAVRSTVTGDTATASFVAEIQARAGHSAATPMRVTLRLIDGDWKVDYTTLASGSSLFR